MSAPTSPFSDLFNKYSTGTATEDELRDLFSLLKADGYDLELKELLDGIWEATAPDENYDQEFWNAQLAEIREKNAKLESKKSKYSGFPFIRIAAAAAVAMMILGAGLFYFNGKYGSSQLVTFTKDIPAGRSGATLTLANGKKIHINTAAVGQLAEESGVRISKTADGKIIYTLLESNDGVLEYNTLETQNGEQTQVILPDQSLVFLNAASSLKYPSSFAKAKERIVELSGEAYFEVSKDKEHPFIVKSDGQQVKVLGTHFNISGYADEQVVRTTLLEGSVNVNGNLLKPGEQSVLSGGSISVSQADIEQAVAWKKGEFYFDQTPLEEVMRQVARWYNVKVIYQNEGVKDQTIGGTVTRYGSVSQILKAIASVGSVHFQITDQTILVK
jgi:transmembrane sensor